MNDKFKEKKLSFWMGGDEKKGKGMNAQPLRFKFIRYWCLNLKCVNFFLVRKHWYTKRRQKGWLVGVWDGVHCWYLSIISEISFISCMIYQYRISDFSETNFWNTINCIFILFLLWKIPKVHNTWCMWCKMCFLLTTSYLWWTIPTVENSQST